MPLIAFYWDADATGSLCVCERERKRGGVTLIADPFAPFYLVSSPSIEEYSFMNWREVA